MTEADITTLLRRQLDYYRARAGEYDQWWLRKGRYDRGAALNTAWFADANEVASKLMACRPAGRVLELACGTGIWTEELLPLASDLTAVDSRLEPTSTAVDHRLPTPEATTAHRRLNDGREYQISKVFYDPADLARRLASLGWRFDIGQTNDYFIYGSGAAYHIRRQPDGTWAGTATP